MNLTRWDSCPSVGQKDGMCSESEVIISVRTWCTYSETDYFNRLSFHIAGLWLLCYFIAPTIRQPIRTSSYSSGLFGWNVRCNKESCPSGTTDVISVTGSSFFCQEPATIAGSAMDLHARYCSSQPVWIVTDALPCQATEALSTGLETNQGGLTVVVHSLEPLHQRHHEKSYQHMDRGDCQRGLHTSW